MKRPLVVFFVAFILCLLLLPVASAHSPVFPGNNTNIDSAYVVNDPTKSWALYTTLPSGQVQYYRFDVNEGESIFVQLYKNTEASNLGFVPSFVLMGPGLASNGTVPSSVTVPPASSSIVIQGQQPDQATYEGFGPGSFYDLGQVEVSAPTTGTYYVAVYDDAGQGGNYGLAIGERETYTPIEYLLIPYSVFMVHLWEGQNPLVVLAPLFLVVVVGLGILVTRGESHASLRSPFTLLGTLAGLVFLGTGASNLAQMILAISRSSLGSEALITLIFVLVPIILGILALRVALRRRERTGVAPRVAIFALGIIALLAWTGLYVGPALALVASIMPAYSHVLSKTVS
ncbi:MAG: hypothetical protein ACXV5P_02290 [Halobacteriota archaeon]